MIQNKKFIEIQTPTIFQTTDFYFKFLSINSKIISAKIDVIKTIKKFFKIVKITKKNHVQLKLLVLLRELSILFRLLSKMKMAYSKWSEILTMV